VSDSKITAVYLSDFFAAFNAKDIDKVISMMTDDCIFDGAAGAEAYGTRMNGAAEARAAFEGVYKTFPDIQWLNDAHYVDPNGEFGVSQWTFTGTRASDGYRIEANGVDLFTFRDGKIATKNAFRKDRPLSAP